ncbi:MAG: glycosyltransferase family 39 protein, partial [Porphyromonadaceae bacterium]|nr:glycosyltransferase family 39 protein [Porphyromonadaceae bacterium]
MKPASKNILFGFLFIISVATLLPVLGLTHLYTDKEAQEAITTVNTLKSDSPFIPLENEEGIVRPPMFYWTNMLMTKIFHQGVVNEYTIRLSSAIAAIIIALAMFRFYSRRNDNYNTAFFSAIIFLSAFEVHRSAITAQSDMVFTVFVTLALFQLYRWYEKKAKGIPLWAILFISAAALTKGVAGILLPCLTIGLFFGLRRESFFRIGYKIVAIALASCLLPAVWYYITCKETGAGVLDQITTAHFYEPLNHISFPSSLDFLYSIFIGFLPWTLLILFSLFALIHKRRINLTKGRKIFSGRLFTENPARLFFLSATGIILLFYLLFEESTSTRIIPIYPFLSIFLAEYMHHLI